MRRFEQTAARNAGFMVAEVPLPRTSEMARKLSSILEVNVAFYLAGGTIARSSDEGWPDNLESILKKQAGSKTVAIQVDGHDLALTPLVGSGDYFILVREKEGGLTGLGGWVLAPTLVLTTAFGCLVFLLAHRIARPLTTLTSWLPNLKQTEAPAEPVPSSLSGRSDELGQLARSLQETHQSLLREQNLRHQSERLATLGRIATSLAHEIRNPAAAIRMHADLISARGTARGSASLDLIREEVERITDLVNQWLFVARAAPPERKPHRLADMLTAVARRQQPALAHAGSHLTTSLQGEAMIACDKLRIEQVLRNLIVNAIQAMPGGGEITAQIKTGESRVELTIQDEGKGFSPEALDRFGEPFFSEREGGMGLGLTLAREVLQAHEGTISAQNAPGGGAAVTISLPLYSPAKEKKEEPKSPQS